MLLLLSMATQQGCTDTHLLCEFHEVEGFGGCFFSHSHECYGDLELEWHQFYSHKHGPSLSVSRKRVFEHNAAVLSAHNKAEM